MGFYSTLYISEYEEEETVSEGFCDEGLNSVRVAQRILQLWRKSLLTCYGHGKANPADPFPEIYLSSGLGELTGPLLKVTNPVQMTLHRADKKTLYMTIEKSINRNGLKDRASTVWSTRLGGEFYTNLNSCISVI